MEEILKLNKNKKKVRGKKRKSNAIAEKLIDPDFFPSAEDQKKKLWHKQLPVDQKFIDSKKIPFPIRKEAAQRLVEQAKNIYKNRPDNLPFCKVGALISHPSLWDSQIIVFFDSDTFYNFFVRQSKKQTWTAKHEHNSFVEEWGINVPKEFTVRGYSEVVLETKHDYEGEIWYIGEENTKGNMRSILTGK